jgi:hypothetical protein
VPWPHSVLIFLDEHSTGVAARIWCKVQATVTPGHHVVVVVQEAKTRSFRDYQSMGATAIAFFPAGTLAFGHAAGWAYDANVRQNGYSHAWSTNVYGSLTTPAEANEPLRCHAHMMNQRDARMLLFGPRRTVSTVLSQISHEHIRELAYLLAGAGGRGSGAPTRWAATWYGDGDAKTMARAAQQQSKGINFLSPWRAVMWQPSRGVVSQSVPVWACRSHTARAEQAAQRLRALSIVDPMSDNTTPAGLVPCALVMLSSA